MELTNQYHYTLSNALGVNDHHLSGRVLADTLDDAYAEISEIWPFNIPIADIQLTYIGTVDLAPPPPELSKVVLEED